MNFMATSCWILFGASFAFFFTWAIFKIPHRKVRLAFLYLMATGGIYSNVLFIKWLTPWGDENPLLLTRLIFMSGILMHSAFAFFVAAFAGRSEWSGSIVFRGAQGLLIATAAIAASTDLVIANVTVRDTYPRFQAMHGPLYLPMLAFLCLFGITMLALFYRAWRSSQNALQKFQIGVTLIASGLVFCGITVTNGIVPALAQKSYLSVWGGVFPILFFAAIIYLIAYGEAILLKREFARLLSKGTALHEDNQVAIREIFQGLRSIFHKGATRIARTFSVRTAADVLTTMVLTHEMQPNQHHTQSSVIAQSILNSAQQLTAENRRMLLALVRAEGIIQEKWLSDKITQDSPVLQTAVLPYTALDENLAEFSKFWGQEIICASPESFRLLEQLQKRKTLNQPVIISGETSTGKATFCRALHHLRGGKNLIELSGRLETIETIRKKISEASTGSKSGSVAILIRHCDEFGVQGLRSLWMLVDLFSAQTHFYLTASENLTSKITEQSFIARLATLELKSAPLRSRPQDTELLALLFARKAALMTESTPPRFSELVMQKLKRHSWPGNITELRESIEIAVASSASREISEIPFSRIVSGMRGKLTPLEAGERALIAQFLSKNNFNKNRTRIELGITVNTLNAKIQKYGLLAPADIE